MLRLDKQFGHQVDVVQLVFVEPVLSPQPAVTQQLAVRLHPILQRCAIHRLSASAVVRINAPVLGRTPNLLDLRLCRIQRKSLENGPDGPQACHVLPAVDIAQPDLVVELETDVNEIQTVRLVAIVINIVLFKVWRRRLV